MNNKPFIWEQKVFCKGTKSDMSHFVKAIRRKIKKCMGWVFVSGRLRRTSNVWKFGHFSYDSDIRILRWKNEKKSSLSYGEGVILLLLLEKEGRLVERKRLLSSLWGKEDEFASRCLDVLIHHLRQKIGKDLGVVISTVRGSGFILVLKTENK
jgi:DNA-binding response OmpR family regulator